MYYVYFIVPEPNSDYIVFGKSKDFGSRWTAYNAHCPDPKLIGLIKSETEQEMKQLEYDISNKHLKLFFSHREFLHYTPEVIDWIGAHTNVDISESLLMASDTFTERRKKYMRGYYQDPKNKERNKKHMQKYFQIDKNRERHRKYGRERARKKRRELCESTLNLISVLMFTKSLCDIYRTRQLEREGFFTKEIVDTSNSEQMELFS